VEACGQTKPGAVLIWNFVDPIHPQYVLEAPTDVYSFQFNPVNENLVAGRGLHSSTSLLNLSHFRHPKQPLNA
jgi:hypothetical protein